jgi:hypothetical protein
LSSAAVNGVSPPPATDMRARLPFYAAVITYGGLLGAGLGLLVLLFTQVGSLAGLAALSDVPAFYIGARLVLTGQSATLYDMGLQSRLHAELIAPYGPVGLDPFVHPPYVALLAAPLGLLALPGAYLVCTAINLTAVAYTLRRLVVGMWPARERRIVLLACLRAPPLYIGMMLGQLPPVVVWLSLTGALPALVAERERQAGLWLALGLLKPPLLIAPLLALLVARRWRTLAVFSISGAVLLGASLLVAGFWIPDYLKLLQLFVQPEQALGDFPWMMQNWRGLVYALLGTDSDPLSAGLIAGLTLASLGLVAVVCWPRPGQRRPAWDICFAVAILLDVLIDPHLFLQDAAIAVLPGLVLWGAAHAPDPRLRALRLGLMLAPFAARVAMSWSPPRIQVGPWFLALLLGAVAYAWPALGPVPGAEGAQRGTGGPLPGLIAPTPADPAVD